MRNFGKLSLCVLVGIVAVSGKPQGYGGAGGGGGGTGGNSGGGGGGSSGGGDGGAASSSGGVGSSGGGGSGLTTDCQRQEVGDGKFKFVCSGVNPEAISLRSEHVLWLSQDGGKSQVVDIEVPNYKIAELIKAGFKPGSAGDQTINVLLKKPETTVDAQVDKSSSSASKPSVKLQYEPVEKQVIYFPDQKPYSPLQGPILPPLGNGGSSSSGSPGSSSSFGSSGSPGSSGFSGSPGSSGFSGSPGSSGFSGSPGSSSSFGSPSSSSSFGSSGSIGSPVSSLSSGSVGGSSGFIPGVPSPSSSYSGRK